MTPSASQETLPDYNRLLAAYHRAFRKELQTMLEGLPVCSGDRVLDVGCGDGTYSGWLAPLVAPLGLVTGIDALPAYVAAARAQWKNTGYEKCLRFQQATIRRLPFRRGAFDFIWCAQSLYSLPDPRQALREMARVVRRNGIVAILEDDTLHQFLLPWPVEVEMMVRAAEWTAFHQERGRPRRFYVGRHLRELLSEAGLRPQRRRTYASHREFPIGSHERNFFTLYLTDLRDRASRFLPKAHRRRIEAMLTPGSSTYLVDQPHFSVTSLDHVMWAKKP
jgi:SAM-dependent methyltransferase